MGAERRIAGPPALRGATRGPDPNRGVLHYEGRTPEGLEFATKVNGYPAIGVKGDVPPTETGPVSQIEWWTGQVLYDLYGPVSYQEIEQVGDSVPGSAG
jgi:hypothetical protein